MNAITVIPTPLARASAALRNPRNANTCDLFEIAGRLGQAHRSVRWLRKTIDAYIASAGFPVPFPLARGGSLLTGVHRDSRWPLAAVDAWFEDHLPPGARAKIDQVERQAIDSRLNAAAMTMFGGGA